MDYDRWDAVLHYLFRQTQGDAWFRPDEQHISSGVALRISPGNPTNSEPPEFRIFPYERAELEPFEQAVVGLNPEVAVKLRNAAVHAALAETPPEDTSIYVDSNTRIQILDTMLHLPNADKEQCAAFIRDERVLVVWSHSLDAIIPTCHDFEERLIKLLWRSRPPVPPSTSGSVAGSVSGHSLTASNRKTRSGSSYQHDSVDSEKEKLGLGIGGISGAMGEIGDAGRSKDALAPEHTGGKRGKMKRTWYGKKVWVRDDDEDDVERGAPEKRPAMLYAPVYNGIAAAMAFLFIGNGLKILLQEWTMDGAFLRFALCITLPLLYCVSLFFSLSLIQNISNAVGPIAHFHENSKYYSAVKPRANKAVDNDLPHVTIQMPVYKESLESVLTPSILSLKKAMQTYARQGGTSTIFVNDDGLRVLPEADRDERIAFYANHGIGWVARPRHDDSPDGFKRAGRFKKASNMNYGLALSLKAEKYLEGLLEIEQQKARENERSKRSSTMSAGNPPSNAHASTMTATTNHRTSSGSGAPVGTGPGGEAQYGMQYQHREGDDNNNVADSVDLEEKALGMAIEEEFESTGGKFRPWAANGKACRLGEIVLIVDSDTVVPEDCLRDAAREMRECPTVAIIQHESDVMQVAHHYFENGIAYFTRRVNRCISMACANGEVAPFMGHNAFLRWKAIQDAAFIDPADGKEKIWSESNVSEDFDMALRLLQKGYVIRWATYSKGGFKEGVSLTIDDEMNRWQKYAYGCNELLFNPLVQWWRKGPIAMQIHRFIWSSAPLHYKISTLAYGIAGTVTIGIINYAFLGFQFPVDGFYMASFEIFLATTVVFYGSGNLGYTLLEYRLGHKPLVWGFVENIMWIPYFFFLFGGMAIPVSQALLAHLFSYNITWSATIKEVERSNFFKEVPKIAKRFWFSMVVSIAIIVAMIICSTSLVPYQWRVDGSSWAVILPLAISTASHILQPIVLNPWLMIFSY
ncbi:hypothetical protein EYR36_011738 [Pleurotus pulmonarius]|nr:hypothetical protein EYR36_011738 [Pleurotus pulmonarius]KAF4607362.1 hypothetical protein EYR38_001430 [Pleurotus pulmonarius]